jgi:uncharacterized membrane protein
MLTALCYDSHKARLVSKNRSIDMAYIATVFGVLARFGGGGGFGRSGRVWMLPFLIVLGAMFAFLFLFVVYLLVRSFYRTEIAPGKPAAGAVPATPLETPLEILQRRYASGEISSEEFEKIKRDLQGTEG